MERKPHQAARRLRHAGGWARAQVDRWIDHQELSGDFPLPFDDPKLAGTTVADVLAKPSKFVHKTSADPFEGPAYGRGKAILYQRENASLFINSFAHGGVRLRTEGGAGAGHRSRDRPLGAPAAARLRARARRGEPKG